MSRVVTILIPCHNHARALPDAVESALAQSAWSMGIRPQIIVINDGSTDDSAGVANDLRERNPDRVQVLHQKNAGQSHARQAGLDIATGDFLIQLDADDALEPTMVAEAVDLLDRNPRAGAAAGTALMTRPDLVTPIHPIVPREQVSWPEVLEYNPFGGLAATMARTDLVRQVGGLAVAGTPGCEDWDLWARLARCGISFATTQRQWSRYRIGESNYSRRVIEMLDSAIELLDRCRRPDPRLSAASAASLEPAPPIDEADYARLHQGRVFYALGLGWATSAAPPTLAQILGKLPNLMINSEENLNFCCTQFRWGLQFGLQWGHWAPARPHSLRALRRVMETKPGLNAELRRRLLAIAANPLDRVTLLRRIMNRFRSIVR